MVWTEDLLNLEGEDEKKEGIREEAEEHCKELRIEEGVPIFMAFWRHKGDKSISLHFLFMTFVL